MAVTIKRNDTHPPIEATLKDANGDPIDLTGAAVKFIMKKTGAVTPILSTAMTIVSPTEGTIKYEWEAGTTAIAGLYEFEFEITFADTSKLTVPNAEYERLRILEDLG
jgi:hypothetical protein